MTTLESKAHDSNCKRIAGTSALGVYTDEDGRKYYPVYSNQGQPGLHYVDGDHLCPFGYTTGWWF
jgi:hypothetical protein